MIWKKIIKTQKQMGWDNIRIWVAIGYYTKIDIEFIYIKRNSRNKFYVLIFYHKRYMSHSFVANK